MNTLKLKEILERHKNWQLGEGGERANLQDADLQNADLRNADLQNANLRNANLRNADLRNADLRNADLRNADLWNANLWNANLQNANLQDADLQDADLQDADLQNADLRNANLQNANLWNADLQNANLWNANLWNANLRNANLRNANLRNANLQDATNLERVHQSNLTILKTQKGKLRAFKYLNGDASPYHAQNYEVGKVYETDDFDTDERVLCGKGLNVATLDWCLQDTRYDLGKTYIEVEFDAEDIVAIPYNTDGKFRVRRLKVIRKLSKNYLQEYLKPLYQTEVNE